MRLYLTYFLSLLVILVVCFFIFDIDRFGFFELSSCLLFIVLSIIAYSNFKYFLPISIFILIGLPSNINNIMPSLEIGYNYERGYSLYPIIYAIELFFYFGVLVHHKKLNFKFNSPILLIPLIYVPVALIYHILLEKTDLHLAIFISGLWQARMIIILLILGSSVKDVNQINSALIFSALFLIIESFVYSKLNSKIELTSGSLGTNSFANLIAATSFLVYYKSNYSKMLRTIILLTFGLAILMADTRSALAAPLLIVIFQIYKSIGSRHKLTLLTSVIASLYLAIDLDAIHNTITYIDKVYEILSSSDTFINSGLINSTNSSIFTRLILFKTSIMMFLDNIILGIGPNLWNIEKYNYGFNEYVLIDSHNGYLSLISQYGIFGLLIIYHLIRAILPSKKIQKKYIGMTLFLFSLLLTELSNAGSNKVQIFSALILTSTILSKTNKNENCDFRIKRYPK